MAASAGLESFFVGGSHTVVTLYFTGADLPAMLLKICQSLLALDDFEPRETRVASCDAFPAYSRESGHGCAEEYAGALTLAWSPAPRQHLLAASFWSPIFGNVVTQYAPVPREDLDRGITNPIEIVFDGSLIDLAFYMPPVAPEQEVLAEKQAKLIADVFRAVCEQRAPHYGAIMAEAPFPTPADIVRGRTDLADVFLSDEMLAADPGLAATFQQAFEDFFIEQWTTGRHYSALVAFNPLRRGGYPPPLSSGPSAEALVRAIRALHPNLADGAT